MAVYRYTIETNGSDVNGKQIPNIDAVVNSAIVPQPQILFFYWYQSAGNSATFKQWVEICILQATSSGINKSDLDATAVQIMNNLKAQLPNNIVRCDNFEVQVLPTL